MRKVVLIACCLFTLICGCGVRTSQSDSKPTASGMIRQFTWEELADRCPFILTAECRTISGPDARDQGLLTFIPEKVYQGKISESSISVISNRYESFREGGQYLLFAEKWASVFNDEDAYFYVLGDAVSIDGGTSPMISISDPEQLSAEKYDKAVSEHVSSRAYPGSSEIIGDYIRESDIDTVFEKSLFVLYAKPVKISNNDIFDRTTYELENIRIIKGKENEGIVRAVLPKDALEIGKEYLLFLNKPDEMSSFYIISSKHSIYEAGSEAAEKYKNVE